MQLFSKYELQDHVAVEIARMYSIEFKEPFFVAIGNYSDFDVCSLSKNIRIELKCESTPSRTGNICVEFWNSDLNAPSGVLATRATLWVHLVVENDSNITAYEYDIHALRKLVIETGDIKGNRNAIFKLIPLEVFRKHSRRSFRFDSKFLNEFSGERKGEMNVTKH